MYMNYSPFVPLGGQYDNSAKFQDPFRDEEPYTLINGREKILKQLQVHNVNDSGILGAKEFKSTRSSSIFDIVYNAYCDHNNIVLHHFRSKMGHFE